MRTTPRTLVLAAVVAVLAIWALTGGQSPASISAAASSANGSSYAPSGQDPVELDRLIDDFDARVTSYGGVTNGTTLGRLYLTRARALGVVEDYARAAQVLDETLAAAPQSLDTAVHLAHAVAGLHRFDRALELAETVLEVDSSRLDAEAIRGDAALALGQYDLARSSLSTLTARLGATPELLIRAANLAAIEGDQQTALQQAADAVDIVVAQGRPAAEQAFYLASHGTLALDLGNPQAAISLFDRALTTTPDYAPALEGRGIARAHLGEHESAVADLTRVTELSVDLHAHLILGDILARAGRHDEATAQYEISLTIADPFGLFARPVAAHHLATNGDLRMADRLARSELAMRRDVDALDLAAWSAYQLGDLERARSLSDEALAVAAPSGLALYHAGAISAAQGLGDRAIGELRAAIALNPYFDLLGVSEARKLLASLED